jgi:uncharacterized protein (TIGR00288 family)
VYNRFVVLCSEDENGESLVEDKRFAVLIDSDNVSAKYITCILNEMTKYGVITYKRIYGDWTSPNTGKWKQQLLENSIMPIQQFSNTTGKNSTDSALIIDAMDILYTNNVDGFCIVSSDSDFTRLAGRLRESGMDVIGMGEQKTPRSFRAACSVFTSLEIILDAEENGSEEDEQEQKRKNSKGSEQKKSDKRNQVKEKSDVISKSAIVKDIVDIITENENKDKRTSLGEIGNRLVKKYPDFDVRNYGYSLLSKFMEEMSEFELDKSGTSFTVSIRDNSKANEEIVNFIKVIVQKSGKSGIDLSEIGNSVKRKYQHFNVKDYGYSKFSKFVQSINGLKFRKDKTNITIVYWR